MSDKVTLERDALPGSTTMRLQPKGYSVKFGSVQGDGHPIIMRDGVAHGAAYHSSPD